MNVLHTIFATLVITSLTLAVFLNVAQTERRAVYVSPGIGIEGIAVGYSTKDTVILKFGNDYSLIEHNKYSYDQIRIRNVVLVS